MSLAACAEIVQRGDPDRFLAVMAAPVAAREILFPLYAFNLEVARAPWVSAEPMIAEMRLQFWRDVAEEIGEGRAPRAHEVAAPLARAMPATAAPLLERLAAMRRWDIYRDPFEDAGHFEAYIEATSGNLAWAGALALGAEGAAEGPVRDLAFGAGVAGFLMAIPELEARGRVPLVDGTPAGVRALAQAALARLYRGRRAQAAIARSARPGLFAFWQAEPVLKRASAEPARVAEGRLASSGFAKRARLMRVALRRRL